MIKKDRDMKKQIHPVDTYFFLSMVLLEQKQVWFYRLFGEGELGGLSRQGEYLPPGGGKVPLLARTCNRAIMQ